MRMRASCSATGIKARVGGLFSEFQPRRSQISTSVPMSTSASSKTSTGPPLPQGPIRLAVLHQAIEPPLIGGSRKAMKPGGYKDSSADIAYTLTKYTKAVTSKERPIIEVVTPVLDPDASRDEDWSFPDTEPGILSAVQDYRATHFWANTVLFADHPLQTLSLPKSFMDSLYMVGQPPALVEKYDDKNWVNELLRKNDRLKLPNSWIVDLNDIPSADKLQNHLQDLDFPYPVIAKPIRGRGSHGVKLCLGLEDLAAHLVHLFDENPHVIIEEFLAGQEGTVTVIPPSVTKPVYWALPVVERFSHTGGVAPYNGTVAVAQNSRVIPLDVQAYHIRPDNTPYERSNFEGEEYQNAYVDIRRQCEIVGETLKCTAPIRIDVRRRREGEGTASNNPFFLFDVNMKPNMTGPGRPGRDDQASLTAIAAEALGWNYARLLQEALTTARPLREIRDIKLKQT